jgi:hypothetical protein
MPKAVARQQAIDVARQFLTAHPELRHLSAASLVVGALIWPPARTQGLSIGQNAPMSQILTLAGLFEGMAKNEPDGQCSKS